MEDDQKNSPPDPDTVAVYFVNEKTREILFFTKDMLINQLQRDCPTVCTSFDSLFADELRDFSERVAIVYPIITMGWQQAVKDEREPFVTCGMLLQNAMNTLIASIQTLRSGFRLQSGMLIRNAVETYATILHLMVNPQDLASFKSGTFKSTKAISSAQKILPIYGHVWGSLSDRLMHLRYDIHGDYYSMSPYESKEKEKPAIITLGMLGVALWMAHLTAEIVYIDIVESPTYWKEAGKGEGKFSFNPSIEELNWIREIFDQ